jgi:D-erythronate 2-dehydrogenase
MEVLITGGAGFIGSKLCANLLQTGTLVTAQGPQKITRITVLDQAPVSLPQDERLLSLVGNASDPADLQRALSSNTSVVFHLASVVSVAAEQDFDLGYGVNLSGTLALLELCRTLPRPPQFIMASSAAVYGGPLPDAVNETTALFPQTSYGTQKTIAELLVSDYTRKGFIKGCCLRLPTIVVRPGKPNLAASSFASSLVREPLMGRNYECPVPPTTTVCLLSVRRVVGAFVHAASLTAKDLGHTTAVQLPGLTLTVQDMVDALAGLAGHSVAQRVSFVPNSPIIEIVRGWPAKFSADRAVSLGFQTETSAYEIIEAFVQDELQGKIAR